MADLKDMTVTEAFHRLKRALLLFCSALFVWGLTSHQPTEELSTAWFKLNLPAWAVPYLLLLPILYYALGLVLEVLVLVRLNSEAAQAGDALAFDERCAGYLEQIRASMQPLIDMRAKMTQNVEAAIEALGQMTPEMVQNSAVHGPNIWLRSIDEAYPRIKELVDGVEADTTTVTTKLEKVRRDMTRLRRAISGQRQFAFWFWEVGLTAAFVLAAVVIGFSNGGYTDTFTMVLGHSSQPVQQATPPSA